MGFFDKLKQGLFKTKNAIVGKIDSLIKRFTKVDEELFDELERRFPLWLELNGAKEKSEWYIPFVVDELIREGKADCRVLPTESSWFGVTYREDKPYVTSEIGKLVAAGEYPADLLKK